MEHYAKLFDLSWVEPWLIEAMVVIVGALLLVFAICKALDCFNGESS